MYVNSYVYTMLDFIMYTDIFTIKSILINQCWWNIKDILTFTHVKYTMLISAYILFIINIYYNLVVWDDILNNLL